MTASLDFAICVGNGAVGCLINERADVVWGCFPRFDGDPLFCSLLRDPSPDADFGYLAVDLLDGVKTEQQYQRNTPVLITRLYDRTGGCIEITDFSPRFRQHGRMFCPMMLVRQVRRMTGNPRVRIRMRPATDYGAARTTTTSGSNHVRYIATGVVLRLTTDASITATLEENAFYLEDDVTLLFGPDETVHGSVGELGRHFLEETVAYWSGWVRHLGIPFEWQDAVIRAAITLELNVYDDTGAVIAAVTTSIPEAPGSGRNWDYRYCWLRDAYFVVTALNRLGSTRTMERYLEYILNIIAGATGGQNTSRCMGSAVRPISMSASSTRFRVIAGWGPCAWGTPRTDRFSTMYMARRSSPPRMCSTTGVSTGRVTKRSSSVSRRSASAPRRCSTSRTPGYGNCGRGSTSTRSPA